MDLSVLQAAELLLQGKAVALPTETVYGLAAHALDPQALKAIFEIKGRPLTNPLIVHVLCQGEAEKLTLAPFSSRAQRLVKAFWPGPLTLILPKAPSVPDVLTAGRPTIALRSPKHPLFREILSLCKLPLAAPSANPSGYLSPTEANHVRHMFHEAPIPIVDGGPCQLGLESTILDLCGPQARLLRPGPLSAEALEMVLGESLLTPCMQASPHTPLLAPGILIQHYSPRTPLYLYPYGSALEKKTAKTALIYFKKPQNLEEHTYFLSETGSLSEAAAQVFRMLHTLDVQGYNAICIEAAPPEGLGLSINDRLTRAAAKFSGI